VAAPFTDDAGEVASRWRTLTAAEVTVAETRLADAEALVRGLVPLIEDYVTAGTVLASNVVRVQVEMVLRLLKNPLGVRQESRTIDDFAHSWTRENSLADGRLFVTDEELALLRPRQEVLRVGSIRLAAGLA
jgi:hypothetical protein